MSTRIRFKTVSDRGVKGIIVTAETILEFRRWLRDVDATPDGREGAKAVIDFLEDSYRRCI